MFRKYCVIYTGLGDLILSSFFNHSNLMFSGGIVSETRANPATFKADHPFVFVVRDRTDNLVIVAGAVQNPRNPDFENAKSE